MKVEKDYEEFLELLNKNRVKYCIVGSFALAIHSKPRYTKDIDIFIEPSEENGEKLIQVLKEFGFQDINLTKKDFTEEEQVIQLGYEPIRIDILTSLSGCTFEEVWENKVSAGYGKIQVFFIGKRELIKNKKATHRKQDIADLDFLQE